MIIALVDGEFREIANRGYQINLVYFFQASAFLVVLFICDFVSRKYSGALDLVIPLFAVAVTVLCLPFWMHDLPKPIKIPESGSWFATSNALFMHNLIMGTFFTSDYALSMGARSLFTFNSLNVCLRLWINDLRALESVLFDFIIATLVVEAICYYINREKVKLFLEKEKQKMQEQQTTEILQKVPMGVLVIDKKQRVVFQN
jgi:hypothetical protein